MGRVKEKKIIITFYTTTHAMAMEECCQSLGVPGRIISVPPSISAGCGLAWCAMPEEEAWIRRTMEENELKYEAITVCEI